MEENFMKNLLLFTFLTLFSYFGNAQQDVILPVGGKTQGTTVDTGTTTNTNTTVISNDLTDDICLDCWELDLAENFEKKTFAAFETVYGEDLESVKTAAKAAMLEYAFSDYKEFNYAVKTVLVNHAEQFIKINFADYVVPCKKKEKKAGFGNYKFFVEGEFAVNLKLITCIGTAIDEYMSDNVVVLYHPIAALKDKELFEESRNRLQSEYVNKEYKRTSVQNIDAMPVCKVQETDTASINYFRELINCVKMEKGIDAKIAVIVRGIEVQKVTQPVPGTYTASVEVHTQAFNANTNSFVMDEYRTILGGGPTERAATLSAISLMFEEYTAEYMEEEAEKYYNYIADGKDLFIFIPECYTEEQMVALKVNIKGAGCMKSIAENSVTGGTELKFKTWIPLQSDIVDLLRTVKPSYFGKPFVKAEYIEFECVK
jgi:hypothetical protein